MPSICHRRTWKHATGSFVPVQEASPTDGTDLASDVTNCITSYRDDCAQDLMWPGIFVPKGSGRNPACPIRYAFPLDAFTALPPRLADRSPGSPPRSIQRSGGATDGPVWQDASHPACRVWPATETGAGPLKGAGGEGGEGAGSASPDRRSYPFFLRGLTPTPPHAPPAFRHRRPLPATAASARRPFPFGGGHVGLGDSWPPL